MLKGLALPVLVREKVVPIELGRELRQMREERLHPPR